ncbi:MAG TPA: isoleucine--tRNA ligase [Patescibacteria group bacterium]|nr:isoleucine--tRNA ligase [Patescibacteria group bacterium]
MESKISQKEKEILKFWQDHKIFEKTLEKESPKGDFVFYDGPPFATGTPHYGHIVASLMKDVVPRFWTMSGYHVDRVWGWDCHGLPIENIVEKELGFKTKKEIIEFGVDKFNEACRSKVLTFVEEWKKTILRLGRWADMDNAYKTMDLGFMESVWWVFKELWDQGLIYQDYKSMHICPRCETTLSQQEVSEGYKDIKDISVTVKFELVDEPGTYILAWTTTPWTLPGNVALAISKNIDYVKVRLGSPKDGFDCILAKAALPRIFGDRPYKIISQITPKDLVGKKYKPLFPYYLKSNLENKNNLYAIQAADFVATDEGTGIVHIAPAFGQDDLDLGKQKSLPFIQNVTTSGQFTNDVKDFAELNVKPIDDPKATDKKIIEYLKNKNLLFSSDEYLHSYPHCWRCDTPLINYATSSWFVNVTKIKTKVIRLAKKINWSPAHIKEGRFGKWLDGAKDWSISRQRFWASVMPIWVCAKCEEKKVFGKILDLEKTSGQKITDLHKHIIDKIVFPCSKCGGETRRVPDVLDTWFDSGSMPYAQRHYPFENKNKLEKNFPAEFIAEGVDQTRAWFYYLHLIGTVIKNKPAFKNVIVNGIVLAENGKKMSKKLNNYPDPNLVMEKYGADALRYYLLTSPVMEAETLNFSEIGVKESLQKVIMLVDNVLSFYQLYQTEKLSVKSYQLKAINILDQWILAKLNLLIQEITDAMENYDLIKAGRPFGKFINELSTWYVRRSRERFKAGDETGVKTLGYVLLELSKLMAPFTPFIAENIYREIGGEKESVHLETWSKVNKKLIDKKLLDEMELARKIVYDCLTARAEAKIKIRQPLRCYVTKAAKKLNSDLIEIIKDELNIKELKFGKTNQLDTEITAELKSEGNAREIIRQINQLRKEQDLTIKDKIVIYYSGLDEIFEQFAEEIKKATMAGDVKIGGIEGMKEITEGRIGIKKL